VTRLKRWAPEDPITVKLNDGTKVKGYIAEVTNHHFVVTNRSGGQPTTIDYLNVKEVKEGFGSKTKIALAIAGGVFAMVAFCADRRWCEE
jgi:hypothetical protein